VLVHSVWEELTTCLDTTANDYGGILDRLLWEVFHSEMGLCRISPSATLLTTLGGVCRSQSEDGGRVAELSCSLCSPLFTPVLRF
jgi:hypothetical protein